MLKKARNSLYEKDNVFVNIFNELEKKDFLELETLPLSTPFVKKRQSIIGTTLYSLSGSFQALHADIAYISSLRKVSCSPKVLSFIC